MAPPSGTGGQKDPKKAILAGGITGGLEICITYPTEYIKTQLQLGVKNPATAKPYSGIADCVSSTVKNRGFFGLYRGLSPLLLFSIPKSAVRFWAFESVSKALRGKSEAPLTKPQRLIAGLCAGACEAVAAVTPMETIKVKFVHDQLMSSNPRFRGLFHGVSTIVKEEGIFGIYRGVFATILKQSTNQAIRFFVYLEVTDWLKGGDEKKKLNPVTQFFAGALAGAASVYGNNPIDVVKTRLQGLEANKYKNFVDCFMQILRNEGPLTFYKGTTARLGRVCFDVGFTFVCYESIMNLLEKVL